MRLTRRTPLRAGAAALAAPAVALDGSCVRRPRLRKRLRPSVEARPFAVRRPEIPRRFKQFDYVNTNAPKGGAVRQIAFGTFDNFNLVVAGVKGSLAAGIDSLRHPDGVGAR